MKRVFLLLCAAMLTAQAWAVDKNYDFSAVCESGQTLYYKITNNTDEPYTVAVVAPTINNNSFSWNSTIRPSGNLVIPENVTYNNISYTITYIGEKAFFGCSGITSISVPNSLQGVDLKAFDLDDNKNLIIGNNTMNEYGNALYLGNIDNPYVLLMKVMSTSITSFEINDGCKCVYYSEEFLNCNNSIFNEYDSVLYVGTSNNPYLCLVRVKRKDKSRNPIDITTCEIHKDCKFTAGSFSGSQSGLCGCRKLKNVYFPEGIVSIGVNILACCGSYELITIPTTVTNIGAYAFSNHPYNDFKGEILIPKSVTSVGWSSLCRMTAYCEAASKPNNWGSHMGNCIWNCRVIRLATNNSENGKLTIDGNYEKKGSDGSLWYLSDAENSHVILTATPNTGYHVKWQDGNKENNRALPVTESKTYSAVFEQHTEEIIPAVPATCIETGLTEGKRCSECGAILVAQEEVPALGHTAAEAVAENHTAPTCTAAGAVDTVVYCSICQSELNRKTVEISATGHKADSIVFENVVASTCTAVGSYDSVVYCSVCQAELLREEKEIAMLSHTYNSTVTPPTCTEIGYTTHTCSVCEYAYNSDTVAANGHTEVVDAAVPATCTGAGKTEGKHCSVCEAVLVAQEDTPALGHTEVVDAAVAATTTSTGLTEGSHCSVCSEVIVAQTVIPMLENGGNENQGETNENETNEGGNNNQGGNNEEGNENQGGNNNPASAVAESTASAVNIYAYGNTIVVENATDEIFVYNAIGGLIVKEIGNDARVEIIVNGTGVYIVKVGNVAKRVMIN